MKPYYEPIIFSMFSMIFGRYFNRLAWVWTILIRNGPIYIHILFMSFSNVLDLAEDTFHKLTKIARRIQPYVIPLQYMYYDYTELIYKEVNKKKLQYSYVEKISFRWDFEIFFLIFFFFSIYFSLFVGSRLTYSKYLKVILIKNSLKKVKETL